MSDDNGERSYEATEHRREEFQKQGRHAQAKDLGGLAATIAALGVIVASRQAVSRALQALYVNTLGDLDSFGRLGASAVLRATMPIAFATLPVLVAAAILAFLASGTQVRFRLNMDALAFKMDRLDPSAGLKRIFALRKNSVQLLLALARVAAVGTVSWKALDRELPALLALSRAPSASAVASAAGCVGRVVTASLVALAVVAAVDFAYSWFSLESEMKMTRQERIDESRQQDGDPKAKARMKGRARQLAKKRAMAGVKNADVIVTNPTHIAVALRYGPKDAAPIVVAKGHDEIALRLRAEARKHGIPILENRPLARALDAQVPVGRPIPPTHFAAVAQVLAFVYRLRRRGALGGTPRA